VNLFSFSLASFFQAGLNAFPCGNINDGVAVVGNDLAAIEQDADIDLVIEEGSVAV